jgi:hypothetical protein
MLNSRSLRIRGSREPQDGQSTYGLLIAIPHSSSKASDFLSR